MNDRIGILLRDNVGIYFFFASCALGYERIKKQCSSGWDIWDVFDDQIPENFGQICLSGGCSESLRQGVALFDSLVQMREFYEQLTAPIRFMS